MSQALTALEAELRNKLPLHGDGLHVRRIVPTEDVTAQALKERGLVRLEGGGRDEETGEPTLYAWRLT